VNMLPKPDLFPKIPSKTIYLRRFSRQKDTLPWLVQSDYCATIRGPAKKNARAAFLPKLAELQRRSKQKPLGPLKRRRCPLIKHEKFYKKNPTV
jgi:hypothetical protein